MPKRIRDEFDTKEFDPQNALLYLDLSTFIWNETYKDMTCAEKIIELSKFDLNNVIKYIDSCSEENAKFFNEIFFLIGYYFNRNTKLENSLEKAFKYTKLSSDYGFCKAYHKLGYNYENGLGCEKNNKESLKYYILAANNNDIRSQYYLGENYEKGIICEKNLIESFKYLKMCADNTINVFIETKMLNKKYNITAKYNVGHYLYHGIGVEKDYNESIRYIKMAADEKFPQAIYLMFTFYYNGEIVEKNIDEAIKYLKLGAEIRDVTSIYQLIVLNYNYGVFDIPQNIEEGFNYIKLFLGTVTIDNIYSNVNKKLTVRGSYLHRIIYEILLQNDMELYFVQELISKYKVFSNLNSLLQFKLNKKKLPVYTKIDRCLVCFEENISIQLFDCLGHYYCQGCTIKIKDCCLCKSHKRCFH